MFRKKTFLFFKFLADNSLKGCLVFFFVFSGCQGAYAPIQIDQKIIALTFDDGPNPLYTPKVLRILEEQQVPATFFVIGRNAREFPETVRQIKNQGHEIGNHSLNHFSWLSSLSSEGIEKEICATQEIIHEITGEYPAFFRSPHGWTSQALVAFCHKLALPVVNGSVKPRDVSMPGADAIIAAVLGQARPGAVIILHDSGGIKGFKDRSQTLEALPRIIQGLKEKGYRFVTVGEMYHYHVQSAKASQNQLMFN